jgi:hypothetical protein
MYPPFATDLQGVYLPILHNVKECCRHPVVIAISWNSDSGCDLFQPLVCRRDFNQSSSRTVLAIPMVNYDVSPLPVRCFLESDRLSPDCACGTYLQLDELPYTTERSANVIPCALLGDRQPVQVNIRDVVMTHGTEYVPAVNDKRCSNVGCKFYGLREYNGMCHICYMNSQSSSG